MSVTTLKIKNKTLAAEARIIKAEERKLKWYKGDFSLRIVPGLLTDDEVEAKLQKWKERAARARAANPERIRKLHEHRVNVVRKEARASHIAYCFLRGTPYHAIEMYSETDPNFIKVGEIASRFSDAQTAGEWRKNYNFEAWLEEAKIYLDKIKEKRPNGA